MIVDFKSIKHDFYGIVEQPVLTLKTPHGTVISTITYISPKLKLRYNDVSEVEFSVPAYNNGEKINNYDEILGDRLVEVEPFGDFILVNPEIENEGGIKEVKKCKAYSKEYALNYKRLNIPAGTYNFYNPVDNENTITTMILEVLPDWTFGDIDSELIGRWRTFENTEDNLYSFMMNTLQETYNCLFLFDTFNKEINVISANRSMPSLPIYLSYNNLLKTVNVTELSDEVITVLSGYGSGDEVDIRSANPNGTNKIYNLDYYISRGDLPDDLTDKWLSYRDMVDLYQDVFSNFNVLYNQKNAELIAGQASLIEAKTEYDAINTTYLTAQTNENPDMEAIANLESELEKAKTKVETCQTLVDEVLKPDLNEIIKQRQDIVKLCKLDSNFSKDEIKILSQYFKEDSITEDTFVIPEYSASSSANISSRIQDSSEAKIKIIGSQIYASNIAEIFDMDTDGFYKSTYTDPDTGEEQYFTSNIDAFEGMEMPSTIENTVVDQLNENLKRKMYEFRGGIFELNFKSEIASEGKLFEKDQYIKGDVVNVDFSYNTDNLDAYVDENSPDTTKARGFIVCANLRNADYSGTSYPSMNITLQGMIRKEVPQVGTDFLSFDIESAIFSCTGSVTEYQKQNVIQELYDYTKDSLIKLAYPSYEFSVESGNFIFAKDFEPFKDKLELGCRINLMLDDEEENLLQPILIEIDLNYDDDSDFSIVFSNKFNSNDSEFKLADLITENTRSSRSVSLNKGSYNAYKDNNTKAQIDNLTYGALDVAKNKIINSANQAVEWNSSGLFLRKYAANGGYEDRQVGLISDTIAFTKDNWKTVDIAIGALDDPNTGSGYGIIAPSIFGTLLCGKNLVIDNPVYKDDGTTISKQFKVDSTGAWLNNSSFVLSQDASEDFAGGKIIIDPRYGIAAGNLNLFTLGDSEGNNGTEIHPSFMDDDGNIIFDETKLIETSEGSIPYVPKNTTFFFNIRTGDAYFGGDINAENIIAGTFNGEVIKPGSIGGDAIANDAINSEHISSIDADSVTISNLSSDNFTGGKIVADSVTTEGLSANVIEAINASIGKIDADKIVSGSVQAGELIIDGENGKLAILPEYGIIAGNSNIFTIVDGEIIPSFKDDNGELIIDENTGAPLNSSFYFDINTGKAYFAGSINASQITSGTISADIIKGSVIEAINLSAGQINADRVNITDGYITNAMIDNLDAGKIKTGTLDASLATIVNLDASNITTGLLNAEYIDTDSISAEFANTVVSHIGEAQIHSAMIKDLTFDKITGFDVNTTNLTIHSEDGKSQWYDNTIQISDANRVRVQIGKDASNDYSMYVWDATGNLMFDALGLTDSGIQREIIRNDMVAEDAAINGSKLDIESVFREMDGSTYTLTSNHLTYDGKSLDLTLQSMSETDKEQGQLLSSQGTQITAIQGQIASKIWQQDIDTATGEMNTKYSELEQELDGFKTTVGETYSTKAEAEVLAEAARNAQKTAEDAQTDLDNAKANLADVTSRVDATEEDIAAAQKAVDDAQTAVDNAQKAAVAAKKAADQAQSDVNALTKRVENAETSISQNTEQISLRATKSEVTTAKDEALNESKSYTDAQIKVSADGITSSVSKTYATKEALTAAETRITQTETSINSQVGETNGLKERMSTVEQTADKFTWLVESGTSSSNFTLTDRVASLLSSEFQIDALTTFKNSATDGTSTVINGGAIKANTISADKLNVTDLSTLGATIGGFTISSNTLKGNNRIELYSNGSISLVGTSSFTQIDGTVTYPILKCDGGRLWLEANSSRDLDGTILNKGKFSIDYNDIAGFGVDENSAWININNAAKKFTIYKGGSLIVHDENNQSMLSVDKDMVQVNNLRCNSNVLFPNASQVGTEAYPSGRHVLANNTSVSFLNSSGTRVRGIALGDTDNILIGDDSGTAGMYGYITAQDNIAFYAGTTHDQCFASIYSNGKRYFQSKPIAQRTISGGTAVRVNGNGTLFSLSSSSMRYKEEITCQLSEELNPERLYDLNVWQYKYREGHLDKGDQRYGKTHIGLLAEDVKQHYPIAANFNEDGYVEDWSERYLIPPMLKLIQMQHAEIEAIKAELKEIRKTA